MTCLGFYGEIKTKILILVFLLSGVMEPHSLLFFKNLQSQEILGPVVQN